jgi:poly-gamma-glutamate synthesis protein (capsule biosynthesis protein)
MVVPYITDELLISDLAKAEEIADFTVVSIHWGLEGSQSIIPEQERWAQLLADNGADVILGSHSHTLQPLTWIHSDAQDKDVLCIYSLGNFVSGQAGLVNMVGGLLSFSIKGDGEDGLCVTDVLFTPTVTYYGYDWMNTNIYLMDQYTDEIAGTHGITIQAAYLSPQQARQYVLNVIPLEYLPDYMK